MFKRFYPYEYAHSVFSIDYQKLYKLGYRGIVFDIDNTLVHHGQDATPEVETLFQIIHGIGLKTVLLSDNSQERIQRFVKNIDSPFICGANKPHVAGFAKALAVLGIKKQEAVVIGDQVLRDILGANKSGMASILVKYMRHGPETKIGIRRRIEKVLLALYARNAACQNRIGDMYITDAGKAIRPKKRKLFCEMNPLFYVISCQKEIAKRHVQNALGKTPFAQTLSGGNLPHVVHRHRSNMIKKAPGVDLTYQKNKLVNIQLASRTMDGLLIHPGEVFSFWQRVGKVSRKKGYKEGRILHKRKLTTGIGGGLCNLANTLNLLVLHSPLDIVEFHTHSDALAPDEGPRVPFSAGTSVAYNNVDYRFKNNTNQTFQLRVWCAGEDLCAELRSAAPFLHQYALLEENHHFTKAADKYYRVSQIYKETKDASGGVTSKTLVWDNRSEVLFDYALIPQDQIQ